MNQLISIELQFFLISILWGALVLFLYDFLRILRRIINHNMIIVTVEDLIFWILASVFIFAMIYAKNSGTIRGFSVMGIVIGMLLYHYILSDWFVMLISRGIHVLLRPFSLLKKSICKGIGFLIKKSKKLAFRIYSQLKNILKSIVKSVKIKPRLKHKK